ncbi:MAG: SdpI family protein [Candidatus Micrarchaeia archaeon]
MDLPKYFSAAIILALCCLLFSIWIAPSLPSKVATHWGVDGKANGFSGSGSLVWLGALPLVMLVFFYAIPKFDPLWYKYGAKAREKYWVLTFALVQFFFAVVLLSIAANLGYRFDMGVAISVLLGLLFVCLGYYLEDCKPSWFVGIRTPWALSSEDNWSRTHKLGAKVFYAIGAALVVCAIVLPKALLLGMFLIIVASFGLFVYSYLLWKRNGKDGRAVRAGAVPKGKKK